MIKENMPMDADALFRALWGLVSTLGIGGFVYLFNKTEKNETALNRHKLHVAEVYAKQVDIEKRFDKVDLLISELKAEQKEHHYSLERKLDRLIEKADK